MDLTKCSIPVEIPVSLPALCLRQSAWRSAVPLPACASLCLQDTMGPAFHPSFALSHSRRILGYKELELFVSLISGIFVLAEKYFKKLKFIQFFCYYIEIFWKG